MAQDPDAPPATPPQSFLTVLGSLERGLFARQLDEDAADLVQAVMDAGRPGSLTIKLALKPNRSGETVEITADAVTRAPRPEREPSTYFFHKGQLSRLHPNQIGLDEAIATTGQEGR